MLKYYQVSGWLSPDGKQHFSCGAFGHRSWSIWIVKNVLGLDYNEEEAYDKDKYDDITDHLKLCEKTLEDSGWAKFSIFHSLVSEYIMLSEGQIEWIMNNLEYFRPDAIDNILKSIFILGYIDLSIKKELADKYSIEMKDWIGKWNL